VPALRDLEHGDLIVKAVALLSERIGAKDSERGYVVCEQYIKGDHPLRFVSETFSRRFGAILRGLVDNYCPLVVSTLADRLIVDSFTATKDVPQLSAMLDRTRFEALQRSVHRDAVTYGDAYVLVWPDADGNNRFYRQRPWTIAPVYDPGNPEQMLCAVKTWEVESGGKKSRRFSIYYRDRLERYVLSRADLAVIKASTTLTPFQEDGEPEIQGHTFGQVPLGHLANGVGFGEFGESEVQSVIPLQNALNKHMFDLLVGMESASWAQRWATGIEVPIDPVTGRPRTDLYEQMRLWIAGKDGKFGQLDGPDFGPFIAVIESTRAEIARLKQIPSYYMNTQGDTPSGAALRVTEAPLQSKVEDRQVHFGPVWESLVAMALGLPEELTAVWRDTSPVSFSEQLDAGIAMKSLGLPTAYVIGRTLGVTEEEAQALADARQAEDDAKAETQMRLLTRVPEE